MHKSECIDSEPCDRCFTLPCVCVYNCQHKYLWGQGEIF